MTNVNRLGLLLLGLIVLVATVGYWRMGPAQAQDTAGEWAVVASPTASGGPGAWRINTTTGYMEYCLPSEGALNCHVGFPGE